MRYLSQQIVFREVPGEISLSYLITGCSLRCPGCHSADSWDVRKGLELTSDVLQAHLKKYLSDVTCVLFFGGEWHKSRLIEYLLLIRSFGLKTALFTGETEISQEIVEHLDYLKTGPYIQSKGGLGSPNTNQKLLKIKNNDVGSEIFLYKEDLYDSAR